MVTCFATELQFRKVYPLDPSCSVEAGKAWRAKIDESSEIFSSDRSTSSTPSFADVVSHGDLFRTDSDAIMSHEKVIRRPKKHDLKDKNIMDVGLTICKCECCAEQTTPIFKMKKIQSSKGSLVELHPQSQLSPRGGTSLERP